MGGLGDKTESLVDPLETETSERSNGSSSITKKVTRNFERRFTFKLLLNTLWDGLVLTPTNFVLEPTSPDRQLAASLYRLAHGVTYTVLEDVLGVSKESGCIFFNKVIRLIVAYFYDECVKFPGLDEQWEVEVRGFIENYGLPCKFTFEG